MAALMVGTASGLLPVALVVAAGYLLGWAS